MLWSTLRHMIDDFIDKNPDHAGVKEIHRRSLHQGKTAAEFLATMDVRGIGHIRDLVPEAFPRVLRRAPLVAEQNIHGAWRVIPVPVLVAKYPNTGGYIA